MISILINLLLTIHVIVSLLIILVVLMQRPKNEGLGAAFGGGMTENIFGAQTSNVLATFTRYLGGAFFFLTLTLSVLYAKQTTKDSAVRERLMATPESTAPAAEPAIPPSDAGPTASEVLPGATPGSTPESSPQPAATPAPTVTP